MDQLRRVEIVEIVEIVESNKNAHYQTIEVALDSRVKRMWIIVSHTRHRYRWIANEWENPWEAFHRQGRVAVKRSELEVNVVLLVVNRFGSIDPALELWLHIKCYTHNFQDSNLDRAVAEDICVEWKDLLNYKKKIEMKFHWHHYYLYKLVKNISATWAYATWHTNEILFATYNLSLEIL